jgi:hypothetical protein
MMINKANDDIAQKAPAQPTGPVDVAKLDMQCHLVIKDKDTGEVLVNRRG